MLNPFQIEEMEFEKAAFGGYKKSDVDAFMYELSKDYNALFKENEDLKKKIEVLAEKIKEYRNDEDYIKDAILYSQKIRDDVLVQVNATSEDIIREAEAKRDAVLKQLEEEKTKLITETEEEKARLVKETEEEIEAVKARNKKAIERETKALAAIKKEVSDFKRKLQETYKEHLNSILSLPFYDEEAEEEAIAKAAADDEGTEEAETEQAVAAPEIVSPETESAFETQETFESVDAINGDTTVE